MVNGIPIAGIPVFKVLKESDSSVVKTLHMDLLLPFSAIPGTSQIEDILPSKTVKPRTGPGKATPTPVIQISESESSSDSEQEDVSRYVSSCRRRPRDTPDRSHATNVSGGSTSQSQDHIKDSNISNITINHSGPSFRNLSSSDVQSSRSASTSNRTRDFRGNIPLLTPPEPRRSGRKRQVCQRFGDWVYQQTK